MHSCWWVIPGTYFFKTKNEIAFKRHFYEVWHKNLKKCLKNLNEKKKKIYNMLKLCTYSWNISGPQRLLPPSKGVDEWPGCLFVDAVFIFVLMFVSRSKRDPLNCTFPQTQMAWAHCISLTPLTLHQQGGSGTFQEVQSLKETWRKKKKRIPIKKKTGKGYLSGLAVLQHTSKNH